MKGIVLAIFCAIALVSAELNQNGCPINPYVDVLKPHPNCNKYYQCVQGELFERPCASDLLFNEKTQKCDWAIKVDCGNRPIAPESSGEAGNNSSDNGDSSESGNSSTSDGGRSNEDSETSESNSSSKESGNDSGNNSVGGNGNPSEAPEICAAEGSNGVLVAHENCNQFYKCSEGSPVAMNCPLNLLFNYKKDECDWPENVNCEGRNQGGNGDNGNDQGEEQSSSEEADNEDGNTDDNNGNNNNGGGNGNPSEAREICAAEGSDGVLVAHENCNQFYKCSEGSPVAMDCPLNLLYNYRKEQCDWPENVNCQDRNQGGNGDNGNGKSVEDSGSEEGDKEDGNNDNNNNNNNGGGNGNPSAAPEICAKEGSDSVLVAHENCNQYYVCRDGLPVTLNCNPNLFFNPDTDQCDWPELVDCGNRRTFTSLNKHLRFFRM